MSSLDRRIKLLLSVAIVLALSALLAFSLPAGSWLISWLGLTLFLGVSIFLLWLTWRWAGGGRALAWVVGLAFVLRLGIGFGLMKALPVYGSNTDQQRAGYIFRDAYRRDQDGLALARSNDGLLKAFGREYVSDQYGGFLVLTGFVYRYLSPDAHRQALMLILSAMAGALGIPFLWRAVRHVLGDPATLPAICIYAFYPESLLLGGSEMREPFLITLAAIAFWGVVSWLAGHKDSVVWISIGVAGLLFFSPPMALGIILILAGWALLERGKRKFGWKPLIILGAVLIVGIALLVVSWNRIAWLADKTPQDVILVWFQSVFLWEKQLLAENSGWVKMLFEQMSPWQQMIFTLVYGIAQPVLPAALVDPATWLARMITLFLSVGWYALIPMLLFSFPAIRQAGLEPRERKLLWYLVGAAWVWVIISALRAGGDQWDNPRYRTLFLVWLSMLAGWAWQYWRSSRNPWLWRWVAVEGIFVVIFLEWYISRTYQIIGRMSFWPMVGLILLLSAGVLVAGWFTDRQRRKRA